MNVFLTDGTVGAWHPLNTFVGALEMVGEAHVTPVTVEIVLPASNLGYHQVTYKLVADNSLGNMNVCHKGFISCSWCKDHIACAPWPVTSPRCPVTRHADTGCVTQSVMSLGQTRDNWGNYNGGYPPDLLRKHFKVDLKQLISTFKSQWLFKRLAF